VGFAREHVETSFELLRTCVCGPGRQRVNVEGFSEDLISPFRLHIPQCQGALRQDASDCRMFL
jgi:hypothetical protein